MPGGGREAWLGLPRVRKLAGMARSRKPASEAGPPARPPAPSRRAPAPPVGLCESCAYQRIVRNTRGSSFSLCERSREDPAFPRYPRLPVLACGGYARREPAPLPDG